MLTGTEPSATIEPFSTTASSTRSSESWSSGQRFQSLPTDDEASPKSQPRTNSLKQGGDQTLHQAAISPMSDGPELPTPQSSDGQAGNARANGEANGGGGGAHGNAAGLNLDSGLLQTTIGSLLQSPAAAQMFLNSLNASSQGQALGTPKGAGPGVKPSPTLGGGDAAHDPTLALFSPLPNHDGIVQNQNDLMGAYHKAVGVNQDVGKLQESIDSLVRSMGLDLPEGAQNPHEPMPVSCGPEAPGHSFNDSEFNVDELLDQLTANNDHTMVPAPDAAA